MFKSIPLALLLTLLSACSSWEPIEIDPSRLAYAVLDHQGRPSSLCFDTISPNNCISANKDSLLERLNPKHRILLQSYILVISKPSQIDCKRQHPQQCRIYFEHIHVDIFLDPKEQEQLNKQLKEMTI